MVTADGLFLGQMQSVLVDGVPASLIGATDFSVTYHGAAPVGSESSGPKPVAGQQLRAPPQWPDDGRFHRTPGLAPHVLWLRIVMEAAGISLIRTPFQAPNANAYAERFVRSIQEECFDRMILFGEGHLRRALDSYLAHYHAERNHQGLGNELIEAGPPSGDDEVVCRERLGGLLKFY